MQTPIKLSNNQLMEIAEKLEPLYCTTVAETTSLSSSNVKITFLTGKFEHYLQCRHIYELELRNGYLLIKLGKDYICAAKNCEENIRFLTEYGYLVG